MIRKHRCLIIGFFLLGLFLSGCPKKVPPPALIERPPFENPVNKLLDTFSSVESLQAKASIRIETARMGEGMNYLLNGFLLYQRPDKLRLLGYLPFGMGVFDALYRNGEFFFLIPIQKKAYTGEVSEFEDLMEKTGGIQVSSEKSEGSEVPNRIRIDVVEKGIHIELRLKEISVNSSLPEDSFQWAVPEGVEVRPLDKLLRGKKPR
jgi:outer membrane lipoprotein-sorting protein